MVDVAVAGALLAVVSFIAVQFVLGVSDSAETSLLRANSRRQVVLLRTSFQNDFGSATVCGTNRFGSTLQLAPDGGSFQLYTDVGGDGTADLVGYRVQGTSLQRKVVLGTGAQCTSLDSELAGRQGWTTLVQPVRTLGARPVFTPVWKGTPVDVATACDGSVCRADTVEVALTVDQPRAGRVDLAQAYALPDSATRAPKGAVQGAASDPVPDAPSPSAPRNLGVVGGEGQVAVSWEAPTGGADVTGYTVHYATSGDLRAATVLTVPLPVATDSQGRPARTVTGLVNGTRYWFWVTAVSDAGQATAGPVSATPAWPLPGVPGSLAVTGTTSSTASISWAAPADGGTVSGYRVWVSSGDQFAGATATAVGGGTLAHTFGGLVPSTPYRVWVTATNPAGESDPAGPATATTAPVEPGSLTVTPVDGSDTTLDVSWQAATGGVTGYRVYRQGTAAPVYEGAGTSFTDTGLVGGTTYRYTLVAYTGAADSPPVGPVAGTTAPAAPQGATVEVPSGTQYRGSFSRSATATSYQLRVEVGTTANTVTAADTVLDDPATAFSSDPGLHEVRYRVKVRAGRTEDGQTWFSPWGATTGWTQWTSPSTPTGLSPQGVDGEATVMDVGWDPGGSGAVAGNRHYRDGGTTPVYEGAGAGFRDTGMGAASTHTYTLVAYNAAGESSPAASPPRTTAPAAPDPVALTTSGTTWTLTYGAASTATSYTVCGWTTAHSAGCGQGTGWDLSTGVPGLSVTGPGTGEPRYAGVPYRAWAKACRFEAWRADDLCGPASADAGPAYTAPDAPSMSQVAEVDGYDDRLQVSWAPGTSPSVTGYRLYRAGTADAVYTGTATTFLDTLRPAGVPQTYTVVSYNDAGDSAASSPMSGTPAPAAPASLTVSASGTGYTLAYPAAATATSYTVCGYSPQLHTLGDGSCWDAGTGAYTSTGVTALTVTGPPDGAPVPAAVSYGGQVKACRWSTALSATVCGPSRWQTALAWTVPGAPTSVAAAGVDGDDTRATVTWGAPVGQTLADGSFTGYRVYRGGTADAVHTGTATTFTDTGRTANTSYTYTVVAYNGAGEGAGASASAATSPAAPGTPVVTLAGTAWSATWAASVGAAGYEVETDADDGSTSTTATSVSATTTATADPGLLGTRYRARARAVNAAGLRSPWSSRSAWTAYVTAEAPASVDAAGVDGSPTIATVTWTAPAAMVPTGYQVYRDGVLAYTGTATSYTDSGLSGGTTYAYTVVATYSGTDSVAAGPASATTAPAAPGTPSVTTAGTAWAAGWTAPADAASYTVELTTGTASGSSTATRTTASNADGADPGDRAARYQVRVRATGSGGLRSPWSALSAWSGWTTTGAPTSVAAAGVDGDGTQATVTWAAPTGLADGVADGVFTGYRVYRTGTATAVYEGTATSFTDTGRVPNTSYTYTVRTYSGAGEGAGTSASATTAPGAPGTPTVTLAGTAWSASWTAGAGAASYDVEVSSDDGTSTTTTSSSTAATTEGADPGTVGVRYQARARSVDASGLRSSWSALSPWTAYVAAEAPASLTASGVDATPGSMDLSWPAPTTMAPTGYKLYRGAALVYTGTARTFTDTGLTGGTTYDYTVVAAYGASESAGTASSGTTAPAAPGTPTVTTTGTAWSAGWTAPTGAASYSAEVVQDAGGTTTTSTSTSATNSAGTDPGTEAARYRVRVRATDAAGLRSPWSSLSAWSGWTTTGAPTSVAAAGVDGDGTQVDVTWAAPTGLSTGVADGVFTGYRVYRAGTATAVYEGTATSFTDTGRTGATSYTYTVRTYGGAGQSAGESASATTAPAAPAAPAVTLSGTTWSAAWTATTGASTYGLALSADDGTSTTTTSYTTASTSRSDDPGTVGVRYQGRVRATDAAGLRSAWSAWSDWTGAGAANAPQSVSAAGVDGSPTTATVTWTAPSAGTVTSYKLYRGATNVYTGTALSYTDTGLTGGTSYTWTVTATYAGTESGAAGPAAATTAPPAPGTPSVATTGTAWSAAWAASTNAAGYTAEVTQDAGGATTTSTVTATTSSAGADPGTTAARYQVRVRATDPAGLRSPWSSLSSWSGRTTTGAPTSVAVAGVDGDGTRTTVTWAAPTGLATGVADGVFTGYRVYRTGTATEVYEGTGTSFTDTGRTPNTSYSYTVRTYNGAGESAGTSASATTAPGAPGTPAVTTTGTAWSAAWTAGAGAATYDVEVSSDSGTVTTTTYATAALSYGADPGTVGPRYQARARSVDAAGLRSAWTALSPWTGYVAAADPASVAAAGVDATPGSMTVSWTAPAAMAPTGYKLYRGAAVVYSGTATSFADTGLTGGTAYSYTVRATYNGGDSSGASASGTTAPSAPGTPTVTATGTAWSAGWTAPAGAASYSSEVTTDAGGTTTTSTAASATNSAGADPGTSAARYQVRVRATDAAGLRSPWSALSAWSGWTTTGAPTSVAAAGVDGDGTQATVTWAAPTGLADGVADGVFTGYRVYRTGTATAVYEGTGTSFTDTGRSANNSYTYTVRTYNGAGESAGASASAITAPGAPGTPAVSLTGTAWSATWTAGTGASTYDLETTRDTGSATTTTAYSTAATSYGDDPSYVGVRYQARARSVNASGLRSAWTALSAYTAFNAAQAPTSAAAAGVDATPGSMTVTWTAPATATPTGYKLYRGATLVYAGTARTFSDTGLTGGTSYGYSAVATYANADSAGAAASGTTAPAAPGTPAVSVSGTSYSASWTASTGASRYDLEVGRDVSGTQTTTTATPSSNTYTDNPGVSGAAYRARARAVDAAGLRSPWSPLSAWTGLTTVDAPGAFAVVGTDGDPARLTATWTAPASGSVTGYKLYRSGSLVYQGSALTFTETGLSGGTSYPYTLVSYNSFGDSPTVAATGTTAPAAPATYQVTTSGTSYQGSYAAATGAATYDVAVARDTGNYQPTTVGTLSSATTAFAAAADPGVRSARYQVRVRAVGPSGLRSPWTAWSDWSAWTTPATPSSGSATRCTANTYQYCATWTETLGTASTKVHRTIADVQETDTVVESAAAPQADDALWMGGPSGPGQDAWTLADPGSPVFNTSPSAAGNSWSQTVSGSGRRPVGGDFNCDGYGDTMWYGPGAVASGGLDDPVYLGGPNGLTLAGSPWVYDTGGLSHVPVAGDFNGDGCTDIEWYTGGASSLWLGGTSGFTMNPAGWSYAVGGTGYQPVAGDFNGDGYDDLYFYEPANTDYLWLGGATNFNQLPGWTVAQGSGYVPYAGEFNGDGYADVLFYSSSGAEALWLGQSASFVSSYTGLGAVVWSGSAISVPSGYTAVVGRFNDDKFSDVLWFSSSGAEVLWLGATSGFDLGLTPPQTSATYNRAAAADVNGDGLSDVVLYDSTGTTAAESVWRGATLTPVRGNFNGDAYGDVLWFDRGRSQAPSLWLGGPNGYDTAPGWALPAPGTNAWDTVLPAAGDFNGDGRTDVLWFGIGSAAETVWKGTANGFDTAPGWTVGSVSTYGFSPVVGDYSGDGKDDVYWNGPGAALVDLLWTGASTGFNTAPGWTVPNTSGTYDEVLGADFTGDGAAEVYFYSEAGTDPGWAPDTAAKTLATWAAPQTGGTGQVPYAGNFNGDGYHDLVVQNSYGADTLWLGSAEGVRQSSQPMRDLDKVRSGVVGDFDGDAHDDLLWYAPGSTAEVLHRYAAEGVNEQRTWSVRVDGTYAPVRGDFNGDGYADVLWYDATGAASSMWLGSGTGFTTGWTVAPAAGYTPVAGDFNGDGRDDIFWYSATAGEGLWSGGASAFTAVTTATSPAWAPALTASGLVPAAGDFNRDGRDDIFWYSAASTDALWLAGASGFTTAPTGSTTPAFGAYALGTGYEPAAGDFNGDGYADLYLYSEAGADLVWKGGASSFTQVTAGEDQSGGFHPVAGNFNGDRNGAYGYDDLLLYRDAGREKLLYGGADTFTTVQADPGRAGGADGAVPFAGDFDGDGYADVFWYNAGVPDGSYTDADTPKDADLNVLLASTARAGASALGLRGFSATYSVEGCNSNGCSGRSPDMTAQVAWPSPLEQGRSVGAARIQCATGPAPNGDCFTYQKGWATDTFAGSSSVLSVDWAGGVVGAATTCGSSTAARSDNVDTTYWWSTTYPSYGQYTWKVTADDDTALYMADESNLSAATNRWGTNNDTYAGISTHRAWDQTGRVARTTSSGSTYSGGATALAVGVGTTASRWVAPGESLGTAVTARETGGNASVKVEWQSANGWSPWSFTPLNAGWMQPAPAGAAC